MRKFFLFLLVFLLVAAGLGYLLYPTVSDQVGQARDAEVLRDYRRKAALLDSEGTAARLQEAAEYNATLEDVHVEDVFTAGSPRTSRDYQNRLNIHEGVLGELVIPRIRVALPVYHNSAETPATRRLVQLETSSLPSDQPGTSTVLAGPGVVKAEGFLGQLGLTDDRMLQDLDQVTPGDLLILNVLDRTLVYRVGEVQTLTPEGMKSLDLTPQEGEERLTLVTSRGDRRLVVQSARIPIAEAREELVTEDKAVYPEGWQNVLLLGSPVLVFGLLIMWIIERFKKRAYLLPGEGRNAARREEKARKQLSKLPNEPVGERKQDETDKKNPEHSVGPDHADGPAAGTGGGK